MMRSQTRRRRISRILLVLLACLAALLFLLAILPLVIPIPPLKNTVPPQQLADKDSRFFDWLAVIPDSGHIPQEEQPDAFLRAVNEFIGGPQP
jgi:hypothetical protein